MVRKALPIAIMLFVGVALLVFIMPNDVEYNGLAGFYLHYDSSDKDQEKLDQRINRFIEFSSKSANRDKFDSWENTEGIYSVVLKQHPQFEAVIDSRKMLLVIIEKSDQSTIEYFDVHMNGEMDDFIDSSKPDLEKDFERKKTFRRFYRLRYQSIIRDLTDSVLPKKVE